MSGQENMIKDQLALVEDYQLVFDSPAGKKVLWDLMNRSGLLNSSYLTGMTPMDLSFREGQRTVILHILGQLNMDMKELENQIKERTEYERHKRARYRTKPGVN